MNNYPAQFSSGPTAFYAMLVWFFVLLIQWGCNAPSQQADIILFGGKIITVDNNFSIQEAVAIKDGKIIAVGSNDEIMELDGSDTEQINLDGKTVMPGINEGHVHPISASQSEYIQSIPDIHSIKELLGWIQREADSKVAGDWIIHPKFFATRMLEMRQPTKFELDSVAPDHPVFLDGSYGGMINSKAQHMSDISADSDHPGILKDKNTGEPTGIIRGSAFGLLALPFVLPAIATLLVYGGDLLGNLLPRPGMWEAEFEV